MLLIWLSGDAHRYKDIYGHIFRLPPLAPTTPYLTPSPQPKSSLDFLPKGS